MQLTPFEWTLIGIVGSLALAMITYFVKTLASKPEKHESDINTIKQTFATKEEVKNLVEEVHTIKRCYASKDDVKEMRAELKEDAKAMKSELQKELKQLTDDVGEIKDKVLYKDDFYRTIVDLDRRVEKLQTYLIERLGGHST